MKKKTILTILAVSVFFMTLGGSRGRYASPNTLNSPWLLNGDGNVTGKVDMNDNEITNVNYIDFDLVNGVSAAEGRLVWNDEDGTLNLGLKGGNVNLQFGQEHVVRGKNVTGSATTNGRPARISGASGNNPEFSFADADDPAAAGSIGLFTEDIATNSNGYVTTFGLVRDMDTSGPGAETWTAGDRIFVSNTIGDLTNVSPTSSERRIFIGIVLRASETIGVLFVHPINVSYLRELSGNNFTTEVANNIMQFNGTIWENRADLTIDGNVLVKDGGELRLNDSGDSHHVGFKAPALTGNQIWTLPDADGLDGDVMFTDGSGNLKWGANASTRAFTFSSPSGGSGTTYSGGHYRFGTTDDTFNPGINFGTANGSYGDHLFLVAAAGASGGTDTVVRINGTTIDDNGNRAAGVNIDVTLDDAGAAGAYYETPEKWVGLVTITKLSGPDLLCNYGGTKYWDDHNENFSVHGVDVTWLGGANDAGADIILRHHKPTGWTYNAGSTPTPPAAIASMTGTYITETAIINGEEGAWKIAGLDEDVNGAAAEGLIVEIVTTANKTFEIGNFLIRVVPQ